MSMTPAIEVRRVGRVSMNMVVSSRAVPDVYQASVNIQCPAWPEFLPTINIIR